MSYATDLMKIVDEIINYQEPTEDEYIHSGQYDKISQEARDRLEKEFPGITGTDQSPFEYCHDDWMPVPKADDFWLPKRVYPLIKTKRSTRTGPR